MHADIMDLKISLSLKWNHLAIVISFGVSSYCLCNRALQPIRKHIEMVLRLSFEFLLYSKLYFPSL